MIYYKALRVVPPKSLICVKAMVPLDLLLENNIFSRTNDLLLDLQCSEEGAIKEYWGFPAICLQTEPRKSMSKAILPILCLFVAFLCIFKTKMLSKP